MSLPPISIHLTHQGSNVPPKAFMVCPEHWVFIQILTQCSRSIETQNAPVATRLLAGRHCFFTPDHVVLPSSFLVRLTKGSPVSPSLSEVLMYPAATLRRCSKVPSLQYSICRFAVQFVSCAYLAPQIPVWKIG